MQPNSLTRPIFEHHTVPFLNTPKESSRQWMDCKQNFQHVLYLSRAADTDRHLNVLSDGNVMLLIYQQQPETYFSSNHLCCI